MLDRPGATAYGGLFWNNNRDVPSPTRAELTERLDHATRWLENNHAKLLDANNNLLWWWVDRGAIATRDPRLLAMAKQYKDIYKVTASQWVWTRLFDASSTAMVPTIIPADWSYYHAFIAYGLTCDRELGQDPLIVMQRQNDFCLRHHPLSPACATHQLMGARLVRDNHCDDPQDTQALVRSLQDTIVTQLTFDPRVLDVYLQRVLELAESGAAQRIKPRWLRRVLDAQSADGGWSGTPVLLPLGGQRNLCLTPRLFGICRTRSNLHTTAQGILLLSLLTTQPDR